MTISVRALGRFCEIGISYETLCRFTTCPPLDKTDG